MAKLVMIVIFLLYLLQASSAAFLKQTFFEGNCSSAESEWIYTLTGICYPFNSTYFTQISYDETTATYSYYTDNTCTTLSATQTYLQGTCENTSISTGSVFAVSAVVNEIDFVALKNSTTATGYLQSNCSSQAVQIAFVNSDACNVIDGLGSLTVGCDETGLQSNLYESDNCSGDSNFFPSAFAPCAQQTGNGGRGLYIQQSCTIAGSSPTIPPSSTGSLTITTGGDITTSQSATGGDSTTSQSTTTTSETTTGGNGSTSMSTTGGNSTTSQSTTSGNGTTSETTTGGNGTTSSASSTGGNVTTSQATISGNVTTTTSGTVTTSHTTSGGSSTTSKGTTSTPTATPPPPTTTGDSSTTTTTALPTSSAPVLSCTLLAVLLFILVAVL